ncbi:MAG TPA: putative inorganic carbon transporter subunit DabA, partial [Alphaproteobacteria bacterium]|nr:putative inorganic carbon transporter subunit DabA [Alphaproteobacteria bacterium]
MLISSPPTPAAVERAIERAIRRLAPLWPLAHFVAVNPFLGVADRPLRDAARHMARASGAQVLMPLSCYANAVAKGRIALEDIAEARAEA